MKIEKFVWLFVLLVMFVSVGCAGPDGGRHDTLALQGYRDVDVATVKVLAPTPYDPDKQGETLRQGLQDLIGRSQYWCRGKMPKAIVEVKITEFHEPSGGAQFFGVDGFRIAYIISARDAVSGTPLGEAHGLKKWRIRGGILQHGLAGAIAEHQFEETWDDTTRQDAGSYAAIKDMARAIDRAKQRAGPEARTVEKIVPATPALSRKMQIAALNLE